MICSSRCSCMQCKIYITWLEIFFNLLNILYDIVKSPSLPLTNFQPFSTVTFYSNTNLVLIGNSLTCRMGIKVQIIAASFENFQLSGDVKVDVGIGVSFGVDVLVGVLLRLIWSQNAFVLFACALFIFSW